jgi:hypothetical protein
MHLWLTSTISSGSLLSSTKSSVSSLRRRPLLTRISLTRSGSYALHLSVCLLSTGRTTVKLSLLVPTICAFGIAVTLTESQHDLALMIETRFVSTQPGPNRAVRRMRHQAHNMVLLAACMALPRPARVHQRMVSHPWRVERPRSTAVYPSCR